MSGYFDRLGEELRLATELRYAPGSKQEAPDAHAGNRLARAAGRIVRVTVGRVGRWPRLGVLAIVAVSGSAAAASIPLLGGSHRLAGRVPSTALALPGRAVGPTAGALAHRLPAGLRYAIPVIPDLEAGDAGWCSYTAFFLPGAAEPLPGGAGACAPASAGSIAIVGGGEPLTNILDDLPGPRAVSAEHALLGVATPHAAGRDVTFINSLVVRDRVAAIRFGPDSFVPQPDPELAPGWRAVVMFTRGAPAALRFLDRRGHPIRQNDRSPVQPVPITPVSPRHLPEAVCALGSSDLPGIGSEWEVVANTAPSRGPLVDSNVLFSCARAWYAFPRSHAVYSAVILLSARNPARRAPSLPGLTPSIRPGDYEEAAGTAGQTTGRRIGNAWLLVQGPQRQLREALLHDVATGGTALRR
ncbi:MAG: hypothetical protein ACR2IP_03110 [Solirubrobacteraceae bacterium]